MRGPASQRFLEHVSCENEEGLRFKESSLYRRDKGCERRLHHLKCWIQIGTDLIPLEGRTIQGIFLEAQHRESSNNQSSQAKKRTTF